MTVDGNQSRHELGRGDDSDPCVRSPFSPAFLQPTTRIATSYSENPGSSDAICLPFGDQFRCLGGVGRKTHLPKTLSKHCSPTCTRTLEPSRRTLTKNPSDELRYEQGVKPVIILVRYTFRLSSFVFCSGSTPVKRCIRNIVSVSGLNKREPVQSGSEFYLISRPPANFLR